MGTREEEEKSLGEAAMRREEGEEAWVGAEQQRPPTHCLMPHLEITLIVHFQVMFFLLFFRNVFLLIKNKGCLF